jgi:hypothetical protein
VRLRDAGFEVEEFTAVELDVSRHGLIRGEKVFSAESRVEARPHFIKNAAQIPSR